MDNFSKNEALLDQATIDKAKASDQHPDWFIKKMQETKDSTDPRDVIWHREVIKEHNPGDSNRRSNNGIMHPKLPRK